MPEIVTEDQVMAWFLFHRLVTSNSQRLHPGVLADAVAEYRQCGMMAADSMLRAAYREYENKFAAGREPGPTR